MGLGCSVSGSLNVAVIMLWSDPRSSSAQNSTNFFASSGEENIRSFTSCLTIKIIKKEFISSQYKK